MDPARLLGLLIRGALGGRRKKSGNALDYLLGRSARGSPLLKASHLLTAAGVAWGLYETWKSGSAGTGHAVDAPPAPSSFPPMDGRPLPARPVASPPGGRVGQEKVPDQLTRLVRLTVAAAAADGRCSNAEREHILVHAREAGIEDLVRRELDDPRPIDEIAHGVSDPALACDLYTLAFTIVRADEGVTPSERSWLEDLATRLGLDGSTVRKIESETVRGIETAASE